MAPDREVARGSPQDSICITVAARFGSTDAAFAHRMMSFPQCCTSFVKIEESPLEEIELSDEKDQIGVTTFSGDPESAGAWLGEIKLLIGGAEVWSNIVELCSAIGNAEGGSGDLSARNATKPAITRAASGGRI